MLGFLRAVKFAWQNFGRNLWLSIVTVVILVLSLVFVNLLSGVQVAANQALIAVKGRVDIAIFFTPAASETQITELRNKLERNPEVTSVTYVSKEDALARFRETTQDDPAIQSALDAVASNPLQASLVIKAKRLDHYQTILNLVQDPAYRSVIEQDTAADSKIKFIQRFSRLTTNLAHFGIGLSALFACIAALMVFNTIRITIYAYREEIGIMKLVGASNAFIRAPFLIESIFYALLAALIAATLVWIALAALTPFLNSLLEGYNVALGNDLRTQFISLVGPSSLAAILLAMLSSGVAVGRYLKI